MFQLHADLVMRTRFGQALGRARSLPKKLACQTTIRPTTCVAMRTTLVGSVLVVALALSGVAGARLIGSLRAEAAPAAQVRGCGTRGEGRSPQQLPSTPGVRIGPLLFWPSIKLPPGADAGNGSEWPFVQKVPVVLAARTKLVLAIAPEAQGLAAFQSRRGGYVSAIRFEACRERTPAFAYKGTVGRYTGFPFAIGRVARSVCVPMDVWVDGSKTPVRRVVPIGRASC